MDDRFDPGLDPDEFAEARAHARAEAGEQVPRPGTELVIRRRSGEIMVPVVVLLVIAMPIAGLGQPLIGGGIAALVLLVVVIRSSRRIARIVIGSDGSISLPGRLAADQWSSLRRISFRLSYPWWSAKRDKAFLETAEVELETGDGRRLRLARGPLFQRSPSSCPRNWPWLGELLNKQARAAGLRVQGRARSDWTATES